jgi:hypothetical protein
VSSGGGKKAFGVVPQPGMDHMAIILKTDNRLGTEKASRIPRPPWRTPKCLLARQVPIKLQQPFIVLYRQKGMGDSSGKAIGRDLLDLQFIKQV